MGKSFTEEEKEMYEKCVYNEAYQLFCEFGYQYTTISRIMHKVGIGKGSFYTFHDSKEALFFRILLDRESQQDQMLYIYLEDHIPKSGFITAYSQMLNQGIEHVLNDPFLKLTMDHELMLNIWHKIPTSMQEESVMNDQIKLSKQLTLAKDNGVSAQIDLETFTSTLRTLMFSLFASVGMPQQEEARKFIIQATIEKIFK